VNLDRGDREPGESGAAIASPKPFAPDACRAQASAPSAGCRSAHESWFAAGASPRIRRSMDNELASNTFDD
jgi:hypothetical protein